MIIFLFALLTVASGRVYPRSGVSDDVEGLVYEIPEYEDPELVLFNLAARGAMPVFKLMQGAKGSEEPLKEKDAIRYVKTADVKKELDEIISGLQTAKNKGKHNLLMEIVRAAQYLMKLKHNLFSTDLSKLEEDDVETSAIFDMNKYSSASRISGKYSGASDKSSGESSLVSDTSGESSSDSDTSDKISLSPDTFSESPLASDTSDSDTSDKFSLSPDTFSESPLASDTSDSATSDKFSLSPDTFSESPLASDTSDESSLLDTSEEPSISHDLPVRYSHISDVYTKHSEKSLFSYEHLKNPNTSRDRYLSPYSLIRHVSISDFPSDKLSASDVAAKKESVSDIPAVMSFVSHSHNDHYSSSDGSSELDSYPRVKVVEDGFLHVESTVKPQVTAVSSDAEDNAYGKKVKTVVKDNMYISESDQEEHPATVLSKKLTWKLRSLVEKR